MAIGERIRFFRTLRGMTQKHLGCLLGFPESSADVRLAQYEVGARKPKADLTAAMAQVLDVAPQALSVPDIDSDAGLMHTLFTLDDTWGLEICECNGEAHLHVDTTRGAKAVALSEMLTVWSQMRTKVQTGEITPEEYARWRDHYPQYDTSGRWQHIPPDLFSDFTSNPNKE